MSPLEQRVQGNGRAVLVWRFPEAVRALATTVLGGGLGERSWVVNAEVTLDYARRCRACATTSS